VDSNIYQAQLNRPTQLLSATGIFNDVSIDAFKKWLGKVYKEADCTFRTFLPVKFPAAAKYCEEARDKNVNFKCEFRVHMTKEGTITGYRGEYRADGSTANLPLSVMPVDPELVVLEIAFVNEESNILLQPKVEEIKEASKRGWGFLPGTAMFKYSDATDEAKENEMKNWKGSSMNPNVGLVLRLWVRYDESIPVDVSNRLASFNPNSHRGWKTELQGDRRTNAYYQVCHPDPEIRYGIWEKKTFGTTYNYVNSLSGEVSSRQPLIYEGTFRDKDRFYRGQWKDGKQNGQGTMTIYTRTTDEKYVGSWRDGKYYGQGMFTAKDGDVYEGQWKDGARSGQGKMTYKDGTSYVGQWKDGEKIGQAGLVLGGVKGAGNAAQKAGQEGCNGAYVHAADGESANGAPIFVGVDGTHVLFRGTRGDWKASDDRKDIEKNMGYVCSASTGDASPVDVTGWQIWDGTKWIAAADVTARPMKDSELYAALNIWPWH